jgi:Uma2 family endonuclease
MTEMEREATYTSIAAFEEMYLGTPFELVNGEVRRVSPSDLQASAIAVRMASKLLVFVEENQLGLVTGADGGYTLDDENMRAPDAAFISVERLRQQLDPAKFGAVAPDLAVEVMSPHDLASEIQQKVALYMVRGVRLVWVIYPDTRQVVVHYPDGTARTRNESDMLDGESVLPGFSITVSSIFPPQNIQSTENKQGNQTDE